MALTQQERIEIVLMSGERSTRVIAADFNARHPERNDISHMTVSKLLNKFRATGSVVDKPRSGRPRTATDEETATAIVASVVKSPHRSTRRLSAICGVSQRSILRVLHAHQWHPYKLQLQHHLSEDDPDRRVQFAEWALDQCNRNPNFIRQVLFSDEANFYVQGEVNKQNHRYWSDANPSWVDPCKGAGGGKVMVWCGIWDTRIVGPVFIQGTLNGERYLNMLRDYVLPTLLNPQGDFPTFFQQDGAPPHYATEVRQFLDEQFGGHWMGRRGPIEWSTPCNFKL